MCLEGAEVAEGMINMPILKGNMAAQAMVAVVMDMMQMVVMDMVNMLEGTSSMGLACKWSQ